MGAKDLLDNRIDEPLAVLSRHEFFKKLANHLQMFFKKKSRDHRHRQSDMCEIIHTQIDFETERTRLKPYWVVANIDFIGHDPIPYFGSLHACRWD